MVNICFSPSLPLVKGYSKSVKSTDPWLRSRLHFLGQSIIDVSSTSFFNFYILWEVTPTRQGLQQVGKKRADPWLRSRLRFLGQFMFWGRTVWGAIFGAGFFRRVGRKNSPKNKPLSFLLLPIRYFSPFFLWKALFYASFSLPVRSLIEKTRAMQVAKRRNPCFLIFSWVSFRCTKGELKKH